MRTPEAIQVDIERLSEHRSGLRRRLGEGRDAAVAAEIKQLDGQLDALWDELRATRAAMRWGDRARIVARARAEERLERAA